MTLANGNLEIMEEGASQSNLAEAEIEAFAGVQVQGLFKGAIEWFDPGLDDNDNAKFVTIAGATLGAGVSAGVGGKGQFQIGYSAVSNTFRVLVSAHLCWGVGAKGTAAFDVGTEHMLNFAGFIKSQLFYAGFKTLAHINAAAFLMLSQALAYCIGSDSLLTQGISDISRRYLDWIRRLNIDSTRLQTARRVNSAQGRRELIYATPETKGILLYAVSHWTDQTAPVFDSRISVSFSGIDVKFFPERKNAIINILKTCVSAAEWKNTIQHIHPQGKKLTESQLGKVEGDIIRFLNYDKVENTTKNEERVKTILHCINHNIEYKGEANSWLQQYLKYRKGAAKVTQHLNYILVRNQDDIRFEQLEIMQNLPGGFGDEPVLMANNLEILAPFENSDLPEYKA